MRTGDVGYKILREINNLAWDKVWEKIDQVIYQGVYSHQLGNPVENRVWTQISPISDEVRQHSRKYFNDLLRRKTT